MAIPAVTGNELLEIYGDSKVPGKDLLGVTRSVYVWWLLLATLKLVLLPKAIKALGELFSYRPLESNSNR